MGITAGVGQSVAIVPERKRGRAKTSAAASKSAGPAAFLPACRVRTASKRPEPIRPVLAGAS